MANKPKEGKPKGVVIARPWQAQLKQSQLGTFEKKSLREHWTIPFGSLMNNAPKCAKLNEYIKQATVLAQLAQSLVEESFATYQEKVGGDVMEFKTNEKNNGTVDNKRSGGDVKGKSSNRQGVVKEGFTEITPPGETPYQV